MSTLSQAIAVGEDDAEDNASQASFGNDTATVRAYTDLSSATNQYGAGFRFPGIGIDPGSTILTATLTVRVYNSGGFDDARADIYCNDVDNAADFDDEQDIWDRAKTTATVYWNSDNMANQVVATEDFAECIQEIVERPNWASGNALVVLILGRLGQATKKCSMYSFETSGTIPTLDVSWLLPAPGVLGLLGVG